MAGFKSTVSYFDRKLYPSLVDPINVESTDVAWEIGNKVEIIPASTITKNFVIVGINIFTSTSNDVFELILYKGASGSEIELGRTGFSSSVVTADMFVFVPFQTSMINANERISIAIAGKDTTSNQLRVKLQYFEHINS